MPGYVSHNSFQSEDGENVTIVEFDSMEHMEAWRRRGRGGGGHQFERTPDCNFSST